MLLEMDCFNKYYEKNMSVFVGVFVSVILLRNSAVKLFKVTDIKFCS